jgi:mannosyl-3-phosphoglycerate phosphatase
MREYDEPFLLEGPQALVDEVCRQIVVRGLRWTKCERFFHLRGDTERGEAAELLMRCYQRDQRLRPQRHPVESVGIGDSIADVPLLAVVDHPVLVQKPDGSFDTDVLLPRLTRTQGLGPLGWTDAVLRLVRHRFSGAIEGMELAG